MKTAIFRGKGTIEVGERPDPEPHQVGSIGHEYIGVVESIGSDVTDLAVGDFVIAPFRAPFADATLVKVPQPPEGRFTDERLASFTALSDVACTGYHAAVSAGVHLDHVAEAYAAMDERRAITSLLTIGQL
jgi:alcohol dehydrogenase